MPITIIADDLTGANDTAVPFARQGFRTATALRAEAAQVLDAHGYEVIAYATQSRALPPERAHEAVQQAVYRLAARHDTIIYKKIDSALRGPIAAELTALLKASPRVEKILIAPAFPATGRTTLFGEQRIDGLPVHLTPMADDPVTPVRISHIPTLIKMESEYGVHSLSRPTIAGGIDSVRTELARLPVDVRLVVADAVDDSDLDVLAQLVLEDHRIAPCGSAGLAAAMARGLGARERRFDEQTARSKPGLLMVVGSKSPRARSQIQAVKEEAPWVQHASVQLESLVSAGGEVRNNLETAIVGVVERVNAALAESDACVVYPIGEARGLHPEQITPVLAAITRAVVENSPVGTFLLTGGDTAADVLAKLDAAALEVRTELAPGVAAGQIVGGVADGARVITKAGSFGDERLLVRLALEWQRERARGGG